MRPSPSQSPSKRSRGFREFLSQRGVYNLVAGAAVLTAVIWFFAAKTPEDAGRGGACAVAISFLLLFLRRNYGERVVEIALQNNREIYRKMQREHERDAFSDLESKQLLLALVGWMNTETNAQDRQNVALFISSVVGTVIWGFADVFWAPAHFWMLAFLNHWKH